MKKLMTMFLFAVILSGIVLAQTTPSISVNVLKYDPSPAESGKFLDLWISASNKGTGIANDYVLELVPGYPFFLDSNENPIRNYDIIDADGIRTDYKLRVAEDAPNGDSILKVKVYKKGSSSFATQDLKISILGKTDVNVISASPETLLPGKATSVTFVLNNTGKADVRDLVVTWYDADKKILPISGESRVKIDQIKVGEAKEITFNMIADPSITQGVHVINLNMSLQRFGISDSRTAQIAFIVGGLTNFESSQQEITDATMSISVANIGVNIGTAVSVSVPEQSGWKIVGSNSVFLGNLNPGDFTVASLQIQPASTSVKKLLLNLDYTDTTGTRQSVQKEITVNLDNIKSTKPKQGISPIVYLVVLVVIVGAGYYLKKKLKKKK